MGWDPDPLPTPPGPAHALRGHVQLVVVHSNGRKGYTCKSICRYRWAWINIFVPENISGHAVYCTFEDIPFFSGFTLKSVCKNGVIYHQVYGQEASFTGIWWLQTTLTTVKNNTFALQSWIPTCGLFESGRFTQVLTVLSLISGRERHVTLNVFVSVQLF